MSKDDTNKGGSSASIQLALSSRIRAQFSNVFKSELPLGLPSRRNVEHRIELIPRVGPIARPPFRMSLQDENEVRNVVDKYLSKGLIRPSLPAFPAPFPTWKKERWFF